MCQHVVFKPCSAISLLNLLITQFIDRVISQAHSITLGRSPNFSWDNNPTVRQEKSECIMIDMIILMHIYKCMATVVAL